MCSNILASPAVMFLRTSSVRSDVRPGSSTSPERILAQIFLMSSDEISWTLSKNRAVQSGSGSWSSTSLPSSSAAASWTTEAMFACRFCSWNSILW